MIVLSRFSFQGPKGPQVSIMLSLSLFSRSFRASFWTQMFQLGVTAPGKEHDFRLCFDRTEAIKLIQPGRPHVCQNRSGEIGVPVENSQVRVRSA